MKTYTTLLTDDGGHVEVLGNLDSEMKSNFCRAVAKYLRPSKDGRRVIDIDAWDKSFRETCFGDAEPEISSVTLSGGKLHVATVLYASVEISSRPVCYAEVTSTNTAIYNVDGEIDITAVRTFDDIRRLVYDGIIDEVDFINDISYEI